MFHKNKVVNFSIIMPTYNRAFCIKNAVDSVLEQDYQNFELLIIDDGSSDGTEELILKTYPEEIKNGKIVFARFAHIGVSHARNMGLRLAKNPWIAYMDTDNIMVKGFLRFFAETMIAKKAECYYKNEVNYYQQLLNLNLNKVVRLEREIKKLKTKS